MIEMSAPADVPAVFRDVLAGLEEQRYVTGPGHAFYECFGCGPGHADGLRARPLLPDRGLTIRR